MRKEMYFELKRRVMEAEKDNYTKINVIRDQNGWYKIPEHSAIIYAYIVAPKSGKEVSIRGDSDFRCASEIGIVNTKNIEEVKQTILIDKRSKLIHESGGVLVFELGYRVEPEHLNGYIKLEEEKHKRVEKLLSTENVFPKLKQQVSTLKDTAYHITDKMKPWSREVVGLEMAARTKKMYTDFLMMARAWKQPSLYFSETQIEIERLKCDVAYADSLRILDEKQTYRLLSEIATTEKELIRASKDYAEAEKRKREEAAAEKAGKKLAKDSETKQQVIRKALNGRRTNTKSIRKAEAARAN